MTPNPETVRLDDPLVLALQKMDVGGYRHLPVVDGRQAGRRDFRPRPDAAHHADVQRVMASVGT